MSFLNPLMLFGIAAVSVPIIIHLLNRRRFQKVVWGAMRFLRISVDQNQRRMRIEDMILLALRCLLLFLLALALARPAWRQAESAVFGRSHVTGVILLDNSYSMGMSDGTRTRFEKAKEAAEQVLDGMPAGSATAVWLMSDRVNDLIPEPTFDLNLARKTIREAVLSDRASDVAPALAKAVNVLQSRLALRKEIYLVTDGQANGWRQMGPIQKTLQQAKDDIRCLLVLVNEEETHNLGISDLHMASGLSPANQPLRFEVKVTNYGKEEMAGIQATLSVDGEPPTDEFTVEKLAPGATRNVSLFAKLRSQGFHALTARLAEDRLPADDQRTLVVRAIPEVRVLLVDGEPGSERRERETFFLRHALVPVPAAEAGRYFIRPATITQPELGTVRMEDYDAVILANVESFNESVVKQLQQFLRRGGGLMVFPGDRINRDFYNSELFDRLRILPAELGQPHGQADQEEAFLTLQSRDYQHPIVSIWNDPGSGTLGTAHFFRSFPLLAPGRDGAAQGTDDASESVPEAGDPRVVLRYADATPAVMERTWGMGKVILFSSTADTAWNDLPVRPAYVPLIHRALGSLVQRQDEGLNLRVGDKFRRRVNTELLDKYATVYKPLETEAIRDLRRVEMVDGWPTIEYDRTDFSGVYDVSTTDPPFDMKFATQPDPAESSLDELSSGQLSGLASAMDVVQWTPNTNLRAVLERGRSGVEFWLPIVIVALLLAGLETCLAQWFSRSK